MDARIVSRMLIGVTFGVIALQQLEATDHQIGQMAVDLFLPVITVPYSNVQITIFKSPAAIYYYAPACALVPNSTYVFSSVNSHQNFVVFSVKLRDAQYQEYLEAETSLRLHETINRTNLQMIPFQSMRFDSTDTFSRLAISNQWISVGHQPGIVLGRIMCSTNKECNAVKKSLDDPNQQNHIFANMEVTFALKKPLQMRKRVTLTTAFEHSSLFGSMEQRFSQATDSTVCMQESVLRSMMREVLNGIFENQLAHDEFVSEDQMHKAVSHAVRMVKPNITSTDSFRSEDWLKTFWPRVTDRPDERAKNLNARVGGDKTWMKALFKPGSSYKAMEPARSGLDSQSQMDWSVIASQLEEADGLVQWNGESFVTTPITLYCINLTWLLTAEKILGNITILTSVKSGDLTSAVNIPAAASIDKFVQPWKRETERWEQAEKRMLEMRNSVTNLVPVGSIIAHYRNDSLPECWLYCNGSSFNDSLYPLLASFLPNNTTPDFRGRIPVGTGAVYSKEIGLTGGEANHTLTVDQLPPHQHRVNVTGTNNYSDGIYRLYNSYVTGYRDNSDRNGASHGTLLTEPVGKGQAFNNLQPFLTTSFIIRAC
ncbi:uncharacterized protein LOC129601336 [Paramacrobiotus metropolitanus]|uniref:uncharacterized protein LOC129601336 n=1 Tax=Paramacrobiotus metropolitanus TaxID=2943436 RepID=UPI002445CCB0|nr:uncharacterized protein LOC129601336 [Paramacrobiotus metropolitanus]